MISVTNTGNAVEVYGASGRWYEFDVEETVEVLLSDAVALNGHPDFEMDLPSDDEGSDEPEGVLL
jgi:hypothetical protein